MSLEVAKLPSRYNLSIEHVYIKEEPEIQIGPEDGSPATNCTSCLRRCAPEFLLQFGSHVDFKSAETNVAEQKVNQALGLLLKLVNRNMCHTCWNLIDMITGFKECCVKAISKREQFPTGLTTDDKWASAESRDGIDQYHKLIWDHNELIETQHELMVHESSTVGTDAEENLKTDARIKQHINAEDDGPPSQAEDDAGTGQLEDQLPETTADATEITELILEVDHYQSTIVQCDICSRNFDGERSLNMHKTGCTPATASSKKYVSCPICTVSFLDNSGLIFHLNKHKGIRPYKCRKFCDRTYASNHTRIRHERKYCEQEGRICPVCGAPLKNEASLEIHIQSVHGEAKYACDICGKKFRNPTVCNDHKRRVHSDERNFICPVCGKGYKSPFALKTHKRLHTQERPYGCHLCEQAFNYNVLLKTHIERYHGSNSIGS